MRRILRRLLSLEAFLASMLLEFKDIVICDLRLPRSGGRNRVENKGQMNISYQAKSLALTFYKA